MNIVNFKDILKALEKGQRRCAYQNERGTWIVDPQIKEAILQAFKEGKLSEQDGFFDKDTLPKRQFKLSDGIRLVPGGTSVRSGSYLAKGVIVMPPSYINVGAYIDEGTMVDSHVLVGSCAQIGKNVHLSTAVQIGGVLEPVNSRPVIIEDDVFIGAGSLIVEGVLIKKRAVLGPGVVLSRSIPIVDLVYDKMLEKGADIPENAIVVSGSRNISSRSKIAKEMGLSLYCPVIVKYRDDKSDLSLIPEELLRL